MDSQERTFDVYFGDAGMQAFQAQQGELPAQAQRNLKVFVEANAGPENLLDATRLVVEMLPDYRLVIEREVLQIVDFQIVDSGATMHLVPVYIANAMMTPVSPPAPYRSTCAAHRAGTRWPARLQCCQGHTGFDLLRSNGLIGFSFKKYRHTSPLRMDI
jgi:hypothetical protein